MNTLSWLLSIQIKRSRHYKENSGFTLVELLMALLLAFLVIAPLMGLMISMLNSDRQEQAKATSEQEVQAAIDYINRDLQQAIYVYDDTGLTAISSQLPSITNGNPVLVFWKRKFIKGSFPTITKNTSGNTITFNDDYFVNSLVAYYLIQDQQSPWSKAARIARFEISDGVPNKNGSKCSTAYDTSALFSICPDDGFQPINLLQKDKTLTQIMNSWTKTSQSYKQNLVVLVDFIDHTKTTNNPSAPAATCPLSNFALVPSGTVNTGFYACVDSLNNDKRSVVEVYLRGNAIARIENDSNKILYKTQQLAYFPTARIRVEGRSFIFTK